MAWLKEMIRNTALGTFISESRSQARERKKNNLRYQFLSNVLPKHGVGAELGVFKGQFTETLMKAASPKKLYLVDPWYHLGTKWDWATGDKSTISALSRILRLHESAIEKQLVEVVVSFDLPFLESKPDGHFDWVYVDTSHAYLHTKDELEVLKRKVKASGVIAGDDWQTDEAHRHHGVCRAVREFVAANDYDLIYGSDVDKQWALKRAGLSIS